MRELILWIYGLFGERITSGPTTLKKNVAEGQRWNLKEDISHELREGIFLVVEYYGDRILLRREDWRHDLPVGVLPIFPIDILDDNRFELVKDN